jgi:hypothetical protein
VPKQGLRPPVINLAVGIHEGYKLCVNRIHAGVSGCRRSFVDTMNEHARTETGCHTTQSCAINRTIVDHYTVSASQRSETITQHFCAIHCGNDHRAIADIFRRRFGERYSKTSI